MYRARSYLSVIMTLLPPNSHLKAAIVWKLAMNDEKEVQFFVLSVCVCFMAVLFNNYLSTAQIIDIEL